MIALARRVVACPGWRWMPGMLALHRHYPDGLRVEAVAPDGRLVAGAHSVAVADAWPDLADPATIGCLEALVRRRQPRVAALVLALEDAL